MPNKKRKSENYFDKEQIRANIVKLTFNEARRRKGPIYEVLLNEFYEAGCTRSACYFKKLVDLEEVYFQRGNIRDHVYNNLPLLYGLFENIKTSEQAGKLSECSGLKISFKCLYECLKLLDSTNMKYDWLTTEFFTIVTKYCAFAEESKAENALESVARIYHKYANYLVSKDEINKAIKYLDKAMQLSRGQKWLTENNNNAEWANYEALHTLTARELSALLLRQSKLMSPIDSANALELNQRAILALAEANIEENKMLVCRAYLRRAEIMMDCNDFKGALHILIKIEADVAGMADCESPKVNCEVFLNMGTCLTSLNEQEKAAFRLRQTLTLSQLFNFKTIEAEAQLQLGKMYRRNNEADKAKEAIEESKRIFMEIGDTENKLKCVYLLAKMKADEIFPYFMRTLKHTATHYCCFHAMRQWKNQCKPFWPVTPDMLAEQKHDEIYCLLE